MKHKKKILAFSVGMSLLLGGCFNMDNTNHKTNKAKNEQTKETPEEKYAREHYVPVQEYTGQGYTLRNGEKTDKIAKAHRDEIDKAVKKFFLDNYKTEVIVHNVVGAVDGASVFVESVGEPHFYTYAIVPIDIDEEKVLTDQVWSQEGQVEDSIAGALYAMIFDEEIATLDHYLQTFVNNHPVIGKRIDAIANVGANGYSTPYYYINTIDEAFDSLFKTYIQNPNLSKDEWKKQLTRNDFDPKGIILTIQLYMKEPNIEPNKAIFDQIVSDIENMDGLPRGSYTVILNDNNVDKKTAIGTKDNSLERSDPNDIIKH